MKPIDFVTIGLGAFAILILMGLVKRLKDRRQAGGILLDAGVNPQAKWQGSVGAMCLFLTAGGLAGLVRQIELFPLALCVAGLVGAITAIIIARGRLEIREHGIWLFSDLIRWDRLAGYRWADEGAILMVKRRGKLGAIDLPPLIVPAESRTRFQELLEEHGKANQTK